MLNVKTAKTETRICGALRWFATAIMLCASVTTAAANTPFGVGRPEPAAVTNWGFLSEIMGRLLHWQAALYREFSALILHFKTEPMAGATLIGLSFVYGVLHAAGPGHGKFIISSYLLASGETARRGIITAFAAAGLQALVAILLVSVLAGVIRATSMAMTSTVFYLEVVSYMLIALIGGALILRASIWRGAPLSRLTRLGRHPHGPRPKTASGASNQGCDHAAPDADLSGASEDAGCGHAHHVDPDYVDREWKRGGALAAILAVGIRPCTGAVIILVFALAQGEYILGMLATIAMASGTGLAVALLALSAVYMRDVATKMAGSYSSAVRVIHHCAELGGGLALLILGTVLFLGTVYA